MNLKKAVEVYKKEGMHGLLGRCRKIFYVKTHIFRFDLLRQEIRQKESVCQVALLNQQVLDLLRNAYNTEMPQEKYEQLCNRLRDGSTDKVYIAIDPQNQIHGYYCVSYGENFDITMNYKILNEPNNLFLFDGYTFKKFRNKGVGSYAVRALLKELKDKGYSTISTMVDEGNVYPEKGLKTIGFRHSGTIYRINLFFNKYNIKINKKKKK